MKQMKSYCRFLSLLEATIKRKIQTTSKQPHLFSAIDLAVDPFEDQFKAVSVTGLEVVEDDVALVWPPFPRTVLRVDESSLGQGRMDQVKHWRFILFEAVKLTISS